MVVLMRVPVRRHVVRVRGLMMMLLPMWLLRHVHTIVAGRCLDSLPFHDIGMPSRKRTHGPIGRAPVAGLLHDLAARLKRLMR
ncbi:hypothetical protein SDC9_143468 [bioreactor metagenome]|uniref:Uncharacterized protein n=1 Tax=bioreactor metagenome TaxID=1076179 RepID=A0A645E3G7_9ZZZZ